jgi:mRNA interferase HigB
MRIVGLPQLENFKKKYADARGPLDAWRKEVACAVWHTTHDIKERYPSADFLSGNRVIFNIKGNTYRLVVKIRYQGGMVLIEWVGTHSEYNKKKF